jgi:uroporphyrinogen III methyltransferase/synthase
VLLVRAAEARDVLPRELEARGIRVTVAPAYRTVIAKEGADRVLALLAPADARRLLDGVIVGAIGPITAETAAEHGLRVSVMPREYTIPALADAIAGHFETAPPVTPRG